MRLLKCKFKSTSLLYGFKLKYRCLIFFFIIWSDLWIFGQNAMDIRLTVIRLMCNLDICLPINHLVLEFNDLALFLNYRVHWKSAARVALSVRWQAECSMDLVTAHILLKKLNILFSLPTFNEAPDIFSHNISRFSKTARVGIWRAKSNYMPRLILNCLTLLAGRWRFTFHYV